MTKSAMRRLMALSLPLVLAVPGVAHAAGFYLQEQSVKGAGRAYSGEVADTGPESLWWNPASIGGLEGGAAAIGFSAILPKGTVTDHGTQEVLPAPVGGPYPITTINPTVTEVVHDPLENGYLPSGAIAYGFNKQLAVGLSITSPYSFTTQYADNTFVSYTAAQTRLRTYDIQPSVAVVPLPGLSLGAGLNVERSVATLSNYLPNYMALNPPGPDGLQSLHGTGWDVGFSLGAQWHIGPATLGLAYKSMVIHHLDGAVTISGLTGPGAPYNGSIATNATFRTPWQLTFGGRFALTPRLTLNAQAVRFGWAEFSAITLGAPLDQAIPETYRDTWSVAFGADYAINPKWTVRAGIQSDQTPTQNGHRDARVPDGNRWNFALGTSFEVASGFTLDAALNYITIADATIDRPTYVLYGTPGQTAILPDGLLTGAHVVVASIGGRVRF